MPWRGGQATLMGWRSPCLRFQPGFSGGASARGLSSGWSSSSSARCGCSRRPRASSTPLIAGLRRRRRERRHWSTAWSAWAGRERPGRAVVTLAPVRADGPDGRTRARRHHLPGVAHRRARWRSALDKVQGWAPRPRDHIGLGRGQRDQAGRPGRRPDAAQGCGGRHLRPHVACSCSSASRSSPRSSCSRTAPTIGRWIERHMGMQPAEASVVLSRHHPGAAPVLPRADDHRRRSVPPVVTSGR